MMPNFLWRGLRFCRFVGHNFQANACQYRAAALTFTSLLSLVPLLSVTFTILSAFPISAKFNQEIQNFIFENFVPATSSVVKNYLNQFVAQTTHMSLFSSVFLIITSVMLLYTIEQALNVIWRVHTPRRGVTSMLLYWAILSITPLLIGASFALSSYIFSLPFIANATQLTLVKQVLLTLAPFILSAIAFTLLYTALPNCEVPFRFGLTGGILAALLFELAKHGFTLYLHLFPTYEIVYGALAAVPIFLIWVYLSWLIILIGAEISYALTFYRTKSAQFLLDGFSHAFYWLGLLWQAWQNGHGLSLYELMKREHFNYQVSPAEQITQLLATNLIQLTADGRYILNCDFQGLSLIQLYERLPWRLPTANALEIFSDHWLAVLADKLKKFESNIQQELAIPLTELYKS